MKSQNFEFLRPKRAVLADLAGFAERYAHEDPASSLIKQRSFVEHAVAAIYERYRLRPPFSDNLNDLMNEDVVSAVGARGRPEQAPCGAQGGQPRCAPATARSQSQLSLECLAQLFDIARWFSRPGRRRRARRPSRSLCRHRPSRTAHAKAKEALEKLRLAEAKYEFGPRTRSKRRPRSGSRPSAPHRACAPSWNRAAQGRTGPEGRHGLGVQRGHDAPSAH